MFLDTLWNLNLSAPETPPKMPKLERKSFAKYLCVNFGGVLAAGEHVCGWFYETLVPFETRVMYRL